LTSRRFLLLASGVAIALIATFGLFNLWRDDFGLFWSNEPKPIWSLEKTSKYLLAHRYIPRNFEGLLMGPSYSDSFMDTRQITGYRLYNMSMDGANATELREVALTAISRGNLRYIVICLTPYITKDHGIKGAEINSKEYWGSLFSLIPVEMLSARWRGRNRIEANEASTWGMVSFAQRPHLPWEQFMRSEANGSNYTVDLDPVAVQHLEDILKAARLHNIRIFAYYYPYNRWFTESVDAAMWQRSRSAVAALFDSKNDVVWDMTAPEYNPLRSDPGCYTDAHLSAAGARLVLADIRRVLDLHLKGLESSGPFAAGTKSPCYRQPGEGSGYDRPAFAVDDPESVQRLMPETPQ
jgi:hypothetical protein